MAKFTRFDPRNKKANQKKRRNKDGDAPKRIRHVTKGKKRNEPYSIEKDIRP
jgi:hypothetical protein